MREPAVEECIPAIESVANGTETAAKWRNLSDPERERMVRTARLFRATIAHLRRLQAENARYAITVKALFDDPEFAALIAAREAVIAVANPPQRIERPSE